MHTWIRLTDRFWETEYEENNGAWIKNVPGVMPWFGIYLKYKCASRILDIGCGSGRNTLYLGKMGFSVTGVDRNGTGLRKAREQSKLDNLKNIDFVRAGASDVPFKSNLFNGIICLFTLHLLDRAECDRTVLELQRVLNHGGILCVAEYVNENFSEERLMALMGDFTIIGSWYEAIPLLSRSSPPLRTRCIIAEKQRESASEGDCANGS